MSGLTADQVLDSLRGHGPVFWILWAGLVALSITLACMMYTRWGQLHPLRKCLGLSLFAHLLMGGFVTLVPANVPEPPFQSHEIHVVLRDNLIESPQPSLPQGPRQAIGKGTPAGRVLKPWETYNEDAATAPQTQSLDREKIDDSHAMQRLTVPKAASFTTDLPLGESPMRPVAQAEPEAVETPSDAPPSAQPKSAESIEAPQAQARATADFAIPDQADRRPRTAGAPPSREPPRKVLGGTPKALIEPTLSRPTIKDVAPDRGPGPGDALAGTVDSMPEHPPLPADTDLVDARPGQTAGGSGPRSAEDYFAPGVSAPGGAIGPVAIVDRLKPPSTVTGPVMGPTGSGAGRTSGPGVGGPVMPTRRGSPSGEHPLPEVYQLRVAPDHARAAEEQGATQDTERAVQAALKWFGANQEQDGHWDASLHGGGHEALIAGRDRQNAGGRADTGMTGLALLTLLGSGQTHLEGDYAENVRLGLQYLMRAQRRDGALGGDAAVYEFMYCHAMATFAMSEAFAMTGDTRLEPFVRRAVEFTVASQDRNGGGWRYKPGDPGDTSQLGWQLMALKSAELGGIPIPPRTRQGIDRFLASVSSGKYNGLVAYRPGERPSRSMTAEAMACRQFLGVPPEDPAIREAAGQLMVSLPGGDETNLYYWYYGTLAMHQFQGEAWQRWNTALRRALLTTQRTSGPLAGTWDPDKLWGTYGGRIYSTSLSALCLEVYYRFLPLYGSTPGAGGSRER